MLDLAEVLAIHQVLIDEFGGIPGVRDKDLLQSAINRPLSGVGNALFYPTSEEQAAAILESIVKNHPFIDGNKRTGYVLMRLLLMRAGKDIFATQSEKYEFVIQVASGELNLEQITQWIRARTT